MRNHKHTGAGRLLLLIACCLSAAGTAFAQPTVYVVRHAEKLAGWPGGQAGRFQPLDSTGRATAGRLSDAFEKGQLRAIFSSATTRTLATAFPLSQKLGIPIKIAPACADTSEISRFLESLESRYDEDDAVLLVSHSNIIPYLLIGAGLPGDCHEAMGITTSTAHSWLLTDFYGELFKFSPEMTESDCDAFTRIPF